MDFGARDQAGHAPGEREMTLPSLAHDAVELVAVNGTGANSLGGADVWACRSDVSWVARIRVGQHESAGQ